MRTFDGYTDSIDSADAISRGQLGPASANSNLTSDDYASVEYGIEGATTPTDAKFFNALVEEFQYVLDLGSVAVPGGLSMDDTDNGQLADVLQGVTGIYAHASDTGNAATIRKRALLAVDGGQASGDRSVVLASYDGGGVNPCLASGAQSLVAASTGRNEATGTGSFILGGYDSSNYNYCKGNYSGILASQVCSTDTGVDHQLIGSSLGCRTDSELTSIFASQYTDAYEVQAVGIACNGGVVGGVSVEGTNAVGIGLVGSSGHAVTLSGTQAFGLGSEPTSNSLTVSGTRSGVVGCLDGSIAGSENVAIASSGIDISTNASQSAMIASLGSTGILHGDRCLMGASYDGTIGSSATESALIAGRENEVQGTGEAAIASREVIISGDYSATLGVNAATGGTPTVSRGSSVLIASTGGVTPAGGAPSTCQLYGGSGGTVTWRVDGTTGDFWYEGTLQGTGADYAEYFQNLTGEEIPPGTLVTRRRQGVRPAQHGDRVLGVVTTHPALLGASPESEERHIHPDQWTPVALLGQVPVMVDVVLSPDLIDETESRGDCLYVTAYENGRGEITGTETRLEVMDVLTPYNPDQGYTLCLCLIR